MLRVQHTPSELRPNKLSVCLNILLFFSLIFRSRRQNSWVKVRYVKQRWYYRYVQSQLVLAWKSADLHKDHWRHHVNLLESLNSQQMTCVFVCDVCVFVTVLFDCAVLEWVNASWQNECDLPMWQIAQSFISFCSYCSTNIFRYRCPRSLDNVMRQKRSEDWPSGGKREKREAQFSWPSWC